MCLFFIWIHLVKSKLVTKAKLGLLFRFGLGFVKDGNLDPANCELTEAGLLSWVCEVHFLCIQPLSAQIHCFYL